MREPDERETPPSRREPDPAERVFYTSAGVGGSVTWRVFRLPFSGQKSNVSALVLPERMPVADARDQLPMFPGDPGGDEPVRDRLLFHVIKTQAEAMQHLAAINELLVQKLDPGHDQRNGQSTTEPKPKRPHLPQNKELRQWDTFRTYYLRLERAARRQFQVPTDEDVTKEQVFRAGGPPVRTTTRIMTETHGLLADQWPPHTWPEEAPAPPSGQISYLS